MSVDTDVVIIGGGGCGLSLSSFLSNYGVSHCLLERHSSTSDLPKSHYLNQRTMEIFRQHKIEPLVKAAGAPEKYFTHIRWMTSLGGDDLFDGKVLATLQAFGGSGIVDPSKSNSPSVGVNLPQIRLEPILHQLARERNPDHVLFSHNVTNISQDDDHVTVTYQDQRGKENQLKAKYAVAADGGRTVGPMADLECDGIGGFAKIVTTHFKADLSKYWNEADFLVNFIGDYGEGGLLPMGPTWGIHSEEWIIHQVYTHREEPEIDEPSVISGIRNILKLPDLDIQVLRISPWIPERVLGEKFRNGRIFIAGDAAHKHPPTGGLGLNTGIADSHNLAWKLAMVLKGHADDKLLDTYESERRPVTKLICDWAMMSFINREVLGTAIGIHKSDAMRSAWRLSVLLDESTSGTASRRVLQENINVQKIEFSALDMELGSVYEQGAVVADGTSTPERDSMGQEYNPTTRPGHRLPHAWLQTAGPNSARVSTHDFVGSDTAYVLITDSHGNACIDLALEAAKRVGVALKVFVISSGPVTKNSSSYESLVDEYGQWKAVSQLQAGGAIIVRPDNYVAWRSIGPSQGKIMTSVFDNLVGKSTITPKM